MKIKLILALSLFLTGCENSQEKIFKECKFELLKITALRGSSLDESADLDRILRRQFLTECMEYKGNKISQEQLSQIN